MAPSFSSLTQKEPLHMNFLSPLMGVNFRGKEIAALVESLSIGTTFSLERDPENKYDPNAIKVIFAMPNNDEPVFVGFVAKEVAEELAPLLDAGYTATATIFDFLGPIKPHLEIEATLADDESGEDEDESEDETGDDEATSASTD